MNDGADEDGAEMVLLMNRTKAGDWMAIGIFVGHRLKSNEYKVITRQ